MRIVQFITRMDVLGGAQIHVFELTKALVSSGHEVIVMGLSSGELTDDLSKLGIPYKQLDHVVVPIRPIKDLKAFFEVRKVVKELNPDMIALHSSKAGFIGRLVAKSLAIPAVFTAHSWSFAGEPSKLKNWLFTSIEKFTSTFTDGVIVVSTFDYDEARKRRVISPQKMQVIHNGIHDHQVKEVPVRKEKAVVRIVMVARFSAPKDHLLLLRALQHVQTENWHLTLIGEGPLLADVKEFVRQHQLEQQVTCTGACRNVAEKLRASDLFVLVSKSEGLPLSIIEAMREGLPIIASDVGGVKELIDHRQTGLLVTKDDKNDLIQALNDVLSNESFRRKLGIAARKKFVAQFMFKDMYEQTESYYSKIVEKGKRREFV